MTCRFSEKAPPMKNAFLLWRHLSTHSFFSRVMRALKVFDGATQVGFLKEFSCIYRGIFIASMRI